MTTELESAPTGFYQHTYLALLDSFAHPGQFVPLSPALASLPIGPLGYQAMIGLALLSRSSSFAAVGSGSEFLADFLSALSGATRVDPAFADVIFAPGDRDDLSRYNFPFSTNQRAGSSTTLIFGVRSLSTLPLSLLDHFLAHLDCTLLVSLSGSGLPFPRRIGVRGLTPVNLARFLVLNAEHSRGADMVLVDGSGRLLGLTPATHVAWHDVGHG